MIHKRYLWWLGVRVEGTQPSHSWQSAFIKAIRPWVTNCASGTLMTYVFIQSWCMWPPRRCRLKLCIQGLVFRTFPKSTRFPGLQEKDAHDNESTNPVIQASENCNPECLTHKNTPGRQMFLLLTCLLYNRVINKFGHISWTLEKTMPSYLFVEARQDPNSCSILTFFMQIGHTS